MEVYRYRYQTARFVWKTVLIVNYFNNTDNAIVIRDVALLI